VPMKQREVQDADNTTWTCVQALSGLSEEAAAEAAEKIQSAEGTVPVVCTPSGGEQSVRLDLPSDWEEMSDDALLRAIGEGRRARDQN
jgi:hypothetical protein